MKKILIILSLMLIMFLGCKKSNNVEIKFIYGKWKSECGTMYLTKDNCEVKNNTFDMAKRIYHIDGKHPTLTTLTGGGQRKTITDGKDLF